VVGRVCASVHFSDTKQPPSRPPACPGRLLLRDESLRPAHPGKMPPGNRLGKENAEKKHDGGHVSQIDDDGRKKFPRCF